MANASFQTINALYRKGAQALYGDANAGMLSGVLQSLENISNREMTQAEKAHSAAAMAMGSGDAWRTAGNYLSETFAAVPDAVLAIATAIGTGGGSAAVQLGMKSEGIASAISGTVKSLAKDPFYWTSFAREFGPTYYEAIDRGESEDAAMATAAISGLLNAVVEIGLSGGSGMQGLPEKLLEGSGNAVLEWVKSALEEGGEEVVQGAISRLTEKAISDDITWEGDAESVANFGTAAQEFSGGFVVGLLLGGGQMGVDAAYKGIMEKMTDRQLGKNISGALQKAEDADEVYARLYYIAKHMPEGSESAKAAQEYGEKNFAQITDGQLGAVYKEMLQTDEQTLRRALMQGAYESMQAEEKESASGTETQETTAINADPAEHTAAEQRVIEAYKEAADEGLVQFVEDSVKNKGENQGRYTLNPVSDRAARDIERLTGVNTTGFRTVIEQRMAEHIYDEHGPNGKTDQSMADINDIGRMQYVLDNYDDIRYGGRSGAYSTNKGNGRTRQADTVVFAKAVNGTYYVVEAVPDTARKTTYIVSAYMSKEGIKNTGASETADVKTPAYTAKTDSMSSPVYTTVSQPEGGVKGDYARTARENTGTAQGQERSAVNAEQNTASAEQIAPEAPVKLRSDTDVNLTTYAQDLNAKRAAALRRRVADAEAELASPAELGVVQGETETRNRIVPESIAARDADLQEARAILNRAGYTDTGFVTGQIERYGGTDHYALTKDGKALIQADSVWYTPQELAQTFVQQYGEKKGAKGNEKEQVSLYDRNAGRRGTEPGRKRAERVSETERLRGGTREHREAADQRRRAAAEQPEISPAEAGVPYGAENSRCQIQPESTWDAEQQAAAEYAYSKGARTVVYLIGDMQVEYEGATEIIEGAWDAQTRTLYVRADSLSRSVSETVEHEVAHAMITQENVERFMELVKRNKTAAWTALYAAYEKRYRSFTDGLTAEEKGLYIWEEILADAYSETNRYGVRAGAFAAQADEAMEGAGEVQAGERGQKFSFGKLKDADVRAKAEEMERNGRTPEEIWQALGVARTMDGRDWRYEIDDSGMEYDKTGDAQGAVSRRWAMEDLEAAKADMKAALTDNEMKDVRKYNSARVRGDEAEMRRLYEQNAEKYGNVFTDYVAALDWAREFSVQVSDGIRLGDFLKHDALFEAYPRLKGVELRFEKLDDGTRGAYNREENSITLDSSLRNAPESTLIHEIQHAIQNIEGFAGGSSPEYWARREYENDDFVTERLQREYDRTLNGLSRAEQNKYIRYTELEGELERLFLSDENSEDGKRYAKLEAEQDALYEELYPNQWFRDLLDLNRRMNDAPGEYRKMYRNTAGEIEARDTAERRNMTAEERRKKMPRSADEDTVFADGNRIISISMERLCCRISWLTR